MKEGRKEDGKKEITVKEAGGKEGSGTFAEHFLYARSGISSLNYLTIQCTQEPVKEMP